MFAFVLFIVVFAANFKESFCHVPSVELFQSAINSSKREVRGNFVIKYPSRTRHSKLQDTFPNSMPFPCFNSSKNGFGRSLIKPKSVHMLKPGDIDVIGAMGDSLIAGNGAMEDYALGTMIENRGISWCAGGQSTWRQFLTLPNILKEYNPNLTGYSTGTGEFLSEQAQMNVAFPVSADEDALRQAKILVKKIKNDPKVNFQEDWKMITIFFGANDLCSAQCYDKEKASPLNHAKKLMVALDYLQKYLPRTFVNLIPVLDVSASVRVKRSMMCKIMHRLFCACFHQGENPMEHISNMAREYQEAEQILIDSGRYDTKEDFTVVIQPFMKFFNTPIHSKDINEEVIDSSYITYDCFHFSQKGHALGANMLWNNLLEPVGQKSIHKMAILMEEFKCPSMEAPFLFTKFNSERFLTTGRQ